LGRKTYDRPLGRTPDLTAGWKGSCCASSAAEVSPPAAATPPPEAEAEREASRLGGYSALRGLMCSRSLGWGSITAEEDALGGTAAGEPSPEKRLARLNLLPPPSSFITRCDEVSRRRPGRRRSPP